MCIRDSPSSDLDHCLFEARCSRHCLFPGQESSGIMTSAKVARPTPGFRHQKKASSNIPWLQAVFKKRVEPPTGHIGQVNGCRAHASQSTRSPGKGGEGIKVLGHSFEVPMRKARSDERFRQRRSFRALHRLPVQPRSAPLDRREAFIPVRVIDNREYGFVAIHKGHRNTKHRQTRMRLVVPSKGSTTHR